MEAPEEEVVLRKQSADVIRRKLEAELRATEEIARIRQSVIEKRLAVELATLGEESPALQRYQQLTIPELTPVEQRRKRIQRRPANQSESEFSLQEADSQDVNVDETAEEEDLDAQSIKPKKRGSFLKGVMRKFKRRLRSEEREQEE